MADLKILESKLAEVLGLASAAQDATKKVEGMLDDGIDVALGAARSFDGVQRQRTLKLVVAQLRCDGGVLGPQAAGLQCLRGVGAVLRLTRGVLLLLGDLRGLAGRGVLVRLLGLGTMVRAAVRRATGRRPLLGQPLARSLLRLTR